MGEFYEYHYERAAVGGYDGKAHVRAELARRQQPRAPLDWVLRMEAESRVRRAAWARSKQEIDTLLKESRAARALAERQLEARWSPMGVLLRAGLLTR